jgi:hypothetical protein
MQWICGQCRMRMNIAPNKPLGYAVLIAPTLAVAALTLWLVYEQGWSWWPVLALAFPAWVLGLVILSLPLGLLRVALLRRKPCPQCGKADWKQGKRFDSPIDD